jgi:hypothetical protein
VNTKHLIEMKTMNGANGSNWGSRLCERPSSH